MINYCTFHFSFSAVIVAVTSSVKFKEPVYLNQSTCHRRTFSTYKMETKEELRKRLTSMQYQVTQEAGTERAFTGKYNKFYETGVYRCIVCHEDLFTSDTKYDSGCGWPAFNDVLAQGKVTLHKDSSISGIDRSNNSEITIFLLLSNQSFLGVYELSLWNLRVNLNIDKDKKKRFIEQLYQ